MDEDRRRLVGEGTGQAGEEGAFHMLGELATVINVSPRHNTGVDRTYEASDPSVLKGTWLDTEG